MAERGGVEPPIPLRVCLISSQVHSTGLCHLSLCLQHFTRRLGGFVPADGSFDGTLYRRNALRRGLLMIHAKMRITLGHLCCPVPQEFSDRVQIHAGHHQSTGEGMAIAMPRVVFESSSLNRRQEPAPGLSAL